MKREKLNLFRTTAYIVSFVVLLSSSFNYLIYVSQLLNFSHAVLFIFLHLLFLVSLCAALENIIIESALSLFNDTEKSEVEARLYGGKRFMPLRPIIFIVIFIACYIIFASPEDYSSDFRELILLIPSSAIVINARMLISGRIRYINGHYMYYNGKFNFIMSYNTDEQGNLVFITEDGTLKETGVSRESSDFKALTEEFKRNGLKSGTKV
ncbi:hypothetical protein V6C21_10135 [[Clostridium] cellulosi]|nr:MAG: hypothetical protein DIU81_01005 [[Clostridium] cellulosi]